MDNLSDFISQAQRLKEQQASAREATRPLREAYAEAARELSRLQQQLYDARDIVERYQAGNDGVSHTDYLTARDAVDSLRVQIERQEHIVSASKLKADSAGREASYRHNTDCRQLDDAFTTWQQHQRRAFLEALN